MEFKEQAKAQYDELEKKQADLVKKVKAKKLAIDKLMKREKAQIKAELSSLYKYLVVVGEMKKKTKAKK